MGLAKGFTDASAGIPTFTYGYNGIVGRPKKVSQLYADVLDHSVDIIYYRYDLYYPQFEAFSEKIPVIEEQVPYFPPVMGSKALCSP